MTSVPPLPSVGTATPPTVGTLSVDVDQFTWAVVPTGMVPPVIGPSEL